MRHAGMPRLRNRVFLTHLGWAKTPRNFGATRPNAPARSSPAAPGLAPVPPDSSPTWGVVALHRHVIAADAFSVEGPALSAADGFPVEGSSICAADRSAVASTGTSFAALSDRWAVRSLRAADGSPVEGTLNCAADRSAVASTLRQAQRRPGRRSLPSATGGGRFDASAGSAQAGMSFAALSDRRVQSRRPRARSSPGFLPGSGT